MSLLKFFRNPTLCRQQKHKFTILLASSYASNTSKETHFGFETVLESEKEERVYEVFENVAEKYDVMNDSMSLGIHRLWKDYFMDRMAPRQGTKLLDVAGGTGDIAFRFLKYLETDRHQQANSDTTIAQDKNYDIEIPKDITGQIYGIYDSEEQTSHTNNNSASNSDNFIDSEIDKSKGKTSKVLSHVTVCDINQAMLDVGKKRSEELGIKTGISWLQGNAESLPVADNTFDAYTIAFGIRNCTHIDQVLLEAYRVLKPGGRFMCLEFSQVTNPVLSRMYDEYSFQVIPVMGQVIAGDWKSYQYLVESIRKFPDQETFASLIRGAGFQAVTYENLMFGVSAIHSGFKL